MKSLSTAFAWELQCAAALETTVLERIGGLCPPWWKTGAHAAYSSQYSLCKFYLDKYENCLIILPSCCASYSALTRVPLDVAGEPWLATGHPVPRQPFGHATELDLNRNLSLLKSVLWCKTWPAGFCKLVNFGRPCHNTYHLFSISWCNRGDTVRCLSTEVI